MRKKWKNNYVIEADQVSKKFCKTTKQLMVYGLTDVLKGIINLDVQPQKLRGGEFWALKGVSFKVKAGESVGLIGINGSGKSTMLKLLNGIFMPDTGEIVVRGRTGALIEAGVGFHPSLTGKENIYLNGTILGMRKAEIDKRFDRIVSFAEIGEFLETPIKNYSSGMIVRLGFSIAVHSRPDILLIDEILAVGDLEFQKKCFQRIERLRKDSQVTIIFVSHDMDNVLRICDRCLLLDHGRVIKIGSTKTVVNHYLKG